MTASATAAEADALLMLDGVTLDLPTDRGVIRPVNNVTLTLDRGEVLAIVGESGSGKTLLTRSVINLMPTRSAKVTGRVLFDGHDLLSLSREEIRQIRGRDIGVVLQDPMTALNPVIRIGKQLTEVIREHLGQSRRQSRDLAVELLSAVNIPDPTATMRAYPHELSGGMRQRVTVAIALACDPVLLILDEPTTALDVTIQKQILELLREQQATRNMAMMLVTHNLDVAAQLADRVAVMYAGRIVEYGSASDVLGAIGAPYTEALLESIPRLKNASHTVLQALPGRPPDLAAIGPGCPFAPRCIYSQDRCVDENPPLAELEPDHWVACWYPTGPG